MLGDRRRPTPGSARLASLLGLENKPMFEASVELILFQRGRGSSSRQAGGAPVACDLMATRGGFFEPSTDARATVRICRNPHGVKSEPTTGDGESSEPGNSCLTSIENCGRAGCRENGTSGSARGPEKPTAVRRHSAPLPTLFVWSQMMGVLCLPAMLKAQLLLSGAMILRDQRFVL